MLEFTRLKKHDFGLSMTTTQKERKIHACTKNQFNDNKNAAKNLFIVQNTKKRRLPKSNKQ